MLNKNLKQNVALKDVIKGELIGCIARVPDKNIEGRVIDESKNMIVIETADNQRKKLIKQCNVFEFVVNEQAVRVDGKFLLTRPEDRIRIKVR